MCRSLAHPLPIISNQGLQFVFWQSQDEIPRASAYHFVYFDYAVFLLFITALYWERTLAEPYIVAELSLKQRGELIQKS